METLKKVMKTLKKVRSIKNGAKILLSIISTLLILLIIQASYFLYDLEGNMVLLFNVKFIDWKDGAIYLHFNQLILFAVILLNYWFFWGLKKDE